jgi:hypothetical protein
VQEKRGAKPRLLHTFKHRSVHNPTLRVRLSVPAEGALCCFSKPDALVCVFARQDRIGSERVAKWFHITITLNIAAPRLAINALLDLPLATTPIGET